eukprot:1348668-Amorphochlora_amoeboformis.AAC.1
MKELVDAQKEFIGIMERERNGFTPIPEEDYKRINQTFSKIPRYQKKVVELTKRMNAVSQKVFKMKTKARELLELQKSENR